MVQDFLDHMRRDHVGYARGGRPSQIAQRPRLKLVAEPGVKFSLALRPRRKSGAGTEQKVSVDDLRHARDIGGNRIPASPATEKIVIFEMLPKKYPRNPSVH
jgi:hypothetical protein